MFALDLWMISTKSIELAIYADFKEEDFPKISHDQCHIAGVSNPFESSIAGNVFYGSLICTVRFTCSLKFGSKREMLQGKKDFNRLIEV